MKKILIYPESSGSSSGIPKLVSSFFSTRFQYGEVFVNRIVISERVDYRTRLRLTNQLRKNLFQYFEETMFVGNKFVLSNETPKFEDKNITLEGKIFSFASFEKFNLNMEESMDKERRKKKILCDFLFSTLHFQSFRNRDMWINSRGNTVTVKFKSPEIISNEEVSSFTDTFSICYLFWETYIRREFKFSIEKFDGEYFLSVTANFVKEHKRKYPTASKVLEILRNVMKKSNSQISDIFGEYFQIYKCSYDRRVPKMNSITDIEFLGSSTSSETSVDKLMEIKSHQERIFNEKKHFLWDTFGNQFSKSDFMNGNNTDLVHITYRTKDEFLSHIQRKEWYFLKHTKLDFRQGFGLSKRTMVLLNRSWAIYQCSKEDGVSKMKEISDFLIYKFNFFEVFGESHNNRYLFNNKRSFLSIKKSLSLFEYHEISNSPIMRNWDLIDFRGNPLKYSIGSNSMKWNFNSFFQEDSNTSRYASNIKNKNLRIWRKMVVLYSPEHLDEANLFIQQILKQSKHDNSSILDWVCIDEDELFGNSNPDSGFSRFLYDKFKEYRENPPDCLLFIMTDCSCDFYFPIVRFSLRRGVLLQCLRGETIRRVVIRNGENGLESLSGRILTQIMGKFGNFVWNLVPKIGKKNEEEIEGEGEGESNEKNKVFLNVGIYVKETHGKNGSQLMYSSVCCCDHSKIRFTKRIFCIGTSLIDDVSREKKIEKDVVINSIVRRIFGYFIYMFEKEVGRGIDVLMIYRIQNTTIVPRIVEIEIQTLKKLLEQVRKDMKFVWVNVRSRPNIQFFTEFSSPSDMGKYMKYSKNENNSRNEEEFEIDFGQNVIPGSIISGKSDSKFVIISPFYYEGLDENDSELGEIDLSENEFETTRNTIYEIIEQNCEISKDWIEEYSFQLCFLYFNENQMSDSPSVCRYAIDLCRKMNEAVITWKDLDGVDIFNGGNRVNDIKNVELLLPFKILMSPYEDKKENSGKKKLKMSNTSYEADLHPVIEILFHKNLRSRFFEL